MRFYGVSWLTALSDHSKCSLICIHAFATTRLFRQSSRLVWVVQEEFYKELPTRRTGRAFELFRGRRFQWLGCCFFFWLVIMFSMLGPSCDFWLVDALMFIFIAYVYPDANSMFGTGWEMRQIGSYLLAFKAGLIPGYSAGFAVVPELKLGLSCPCASIFVSFYCVWAEISEC